MNDLILEVLKHGIEVTLKMTEDGLCYDMNTGAKSGLRLTENDDRTFTGHGRYDYECKITDVSDLLSEVHHCMHGRDFVNPLWLNWMSEEGVVKIKERVVREIMHD